MLIDVMAGMLSAVILGLTMGAIVYFNYKGLTQLQAVADMQRNGSLVMYTMNRVIRGSCLTNIPAVTSSAGLTNSVEGWWFTKVSDRLIYRASSGASMNLVQKGVAGFTCNSTTTNVVVCLNLTNTYMNSSMIYTNTIYPRN